MENVVESLAGIRWGSQVISNKVRKLSAHAAPADPVATVRMRGYQRQSTHCPKSNQNFCDITLNVVENRILLYNEIFRVISGFPRYISCYIAENRFHLGQCAWRCKPRLNFKHEKGLLNNLVIYNSGLIFRVSAARLRCFFATSVSN